MQDEFAYRITDAPVLLLRSQRLCTSNLVGIRNGTYSTGYDDDLAVRHSRVQPGSDVIDGSTSW